MAAVRVLQISGEVPAERGLMPLLNVLFAKWEIKYFK
jgi:hypothetical protein